MNLLENIREGLRSVQANLLRSVLTALIVAIGITSLVGILTAVDGIRYSVNDSLADLGVNTFRINSLTFRNFLDQGRAQRGIPPLKYKEVSRFEEVYQFAGAITSLSANITFNAEAKFHSEKTFPNVWVVGATEEYVVLEGHSLEVGRNFSSLEVQYGAQVVILGKKVKDALFKKNEDPLDHEITLMGGKYKVIGVLEEKGSLGGDESDNSMIIPLITGLRRAGNQQLLYKINVGVDQPEELERAMGEATGIMRQIRHDKPGRQNSFEIAKSETMAERLGEITGVLRIGGFGVGFITLLGASIALMNIMLVSVTERTHEVGVRKALGATPLRIRQQFLIEAIVICVMGGLAGVIFGILVGNLFSRIIGIEGYVLPWIWIVIGLVVCVVVGLLSGYYPAKKASRLDPIESLRFE